MSEPDDTLPEAQFEGEWYRWGCSRCGSIFEEEFDMRGDIVTCLDCDLTQRVQS